MRPLTLSVIAASNRDFSCLEEKLEEVVQWIEIAQGQGADLIVLPECLNRYEGDGVGNAKARPYSEQIVEDWRGTFKPLLDCMRPGRAAAALSFIHRRENGSLANSFFVVEPDGSVAWRYDKCWPTPQELEAGVQPGREVSGLWRGIRLGGAICFDSCFPEHFQRLADELVEVVVFPSLWPGGTQLEAWCKLYSMRVALSYPAWSRIIDLDGKDCAAGGYRNETLRFGFGAPVYTATLNLDRLSLYGNHNQEQMIALQKRYGHQVRLTFDQANCLWFLESLDPSLSESALVEEFGLINSRDYFNACRQRVREAAS